jgi:lipopolysaccharide transport system permease protein
VLQSDRNSSPAQGVPTRNLRVISSERRRPLIDWSELWAFREVTFLLFWRSLKARYRQTYFGLLWAVAQPLVALSVYTLVFGSLVGVPSQGVPYPLFVLCGLIPWNFIAGSVVAMTGSVLADQDLVKRVYFPRLAIPLSTLASTLGNALFSGVLLIIALVFYGFAPPLQVVLVPVFLALAVVVALGLGLMTAALNVRFRDVGYAMPFAMQTLLFLTPVIYPATLLPEAWRLVYALNPAVGIIGGLRWSILGIAADPTSFAISAACAVALLLAGLWFFARSEDSFADTI